RGNASGRRRGPPARWHRAPLHAEGRGRAARRGRFRPRTPARAAGVRIRPRGADRRGDPRCALPVQARRFVPRQGRAFGHVPGGRAFGIAAAARAIADLRLGRLDEETTANVGEIRGGTARNIVPEHCSFLAEARCHDETKLGALVQEILETITFAAQVGECDVETRVEPSSRGYRFKRDDEPVRLAAAALERSGYEPSYGLSGGGADANVFNERGLQCLNLANGMIDIHTPDERIAVEDLERMVDVTLALVEVARAP